MTKRKCPKVTPYVSKAARDLGDKTTSKRRKSQAGATLNNHKDRHH